jgi:hypothetical protein
MTDADSAIDSLWATIHSLRQARVLAEQAGIAATELAVMREAQLTLEEAVDRMHRAAFGESLAEDLTVGPPLRLRSPG